MSRILIVSPSGNLYGSEQVLFDYLQHTRLELDLAVPRSSVFAGKLEEAKMHHYIRPYNERRLKAFYTKVFLGLLMGKYAVVYLNEAGHIRYLLLLARFFRKSRFIIHVRMLEDTDASRWRGGIPDNITVLAISKYISTLLPVKNTLLYDAYPFSENIPPGTVGNIEILRIGIIGRVTKTKGLALLPGIMDRINKDGAEGKYLFELYGEIAGDLSGDSLLEVLQQYKSITLKGFERNKISIYHSVDCILHLSRQEALGRIFFEAIDYVKPIVGFKAAGIGEIADLLQLGHWLADPGSEDPEAAIYNLLKDMKMNYKSRLQEAERKKNQAIALFNPVVYQEKMDRILST